MFLNRHVFALLSWVVSCGEKVLSPTFPHFLTNVFPCWNNIWNLRLCLLKCFPSCCPPKRTLTFFWMIMFSYIQFQIHKNPNPLVFMYTAAKCTFKEKTLLHCDYLNLLAISSLIVCGSHFRTPISSLMWSGSIKIHLFMSSTKNLNLCYC